MRTRVLAALLSLGGTLAHPAGISPYDAAATKDTMHLNVAALNTVNKALAAGDWVAVANGFQQFALNAQKALQSAPPKGDAREWTRLWEDLLFAAYRGVGAAGEKDAIKAKTALEQILGARNAGHAAFKD